MNSDEITELQVLWAKEGNEPSMNANKWKDVLQNMMINEHRKKWNRLVRKAWYQFFLYVVILLAGVVLYFSLPKSQQSNHIWLSVCLILPVYSLLFYWQILYNIRLSRINYTETILKIKQTYCRLEMFKYRWTVRSWFFAPIGLIGLYFMVPGVKLSIWLIILIILIYQIIHNYQNIKMNLKKVQNEIDALSQLS
jgi:hypothetical protein